MLKIIDNTTKQKLSVQNCGFWDNGKIKYLLSHLKCIRNGIIYINDITVNTYNEQKNETFPKSNASFVKQVRRLNKEHFFDDLVERNDLSDFCERHQDEINKIKKIIAKLDKNPSVQRALKMNEIRRSLGFENNKKLKTINYIPQEKEGLLELVFKDGSKSVVAVSEIVTLYNYEKE